MGDPTVQCPKCGYEIKLTESLAAPMVDAVRKEYEQRLADKDTAVSAREASLGEQQAMLAESQRKLDELVRDKVETASKAIALEEGRKARLLLESDLGTKDKEIASLQELVTDRNTKLAGAQQAQAEALAKSRALDDARRELNLEIERQVQEQLVAVRDRARVEGEEGLRLKLVEREQTIEGMKTRIEELQRRADQGSQQLRGEAQEIELEALLIARFPQDTIEPVPKGEFGGDVLQHVIGPGAQQCGTILWECKRTKAWSDGWLAKLRGDQRTAKAEVAVLVSNALPKSVDTFALISAVWVAHPRSALPLATAIRIGLVELAAARAANAGLETKTGLVYEYLTGPRFRLRVQGIVEAFSTMQDDLQREKRAIMRQWAKREEQISRVTEATIGMYGDLEGIAGKALPEIDGLSLPELASEDVEPGD